MSGSLRTIQVSGGNLWDIAAQELGNALQASRIAVLNGISDPFLTGTVTLILPPIDSSETGGLPPTS
jgi:nucleoid-associated protein YgaU